MSSEYPKEAEAIIAKASDRADRDWHNLVVLLNDTVDKAPASSQLVTKLLSDRDLEEIRDLDDTLFGFIVDIAAAGLREMSLRSLKRSKELRELADA